MSSFHLKPITAQDAEREPLAQRLSFVRRIPSPATQAALAQAQQRAPPLLTDGIERQTARQLALSTAGNVENTGGTEP